MAIAIIFLVVFFSTMVAVGLYCRKHSASVDGFVLATRSVGPWMSAFAFGTSYFSAVIFVGYAGQFGWNFGLSSTWIGLGNAFIGSLLAWEVLGRRTRIMTQQIESRTMPDFFGKRYDSGALRVAASAIVFVFLIPYTASLYNGLSSLFNIAFAIPYWVVIAVMAFLTALYVIFGGYMATAINDFIQGIIMLAGIVVVIGAVLNNNGGFTAAVNALSQIDGGTGLGGAFTSFFGPQPLALLFVVILTSLGTWGLPQMVGKFYAIKSEASIRKGTIISTLFAIIIAGGCYFLGGFGRLYADKLAIVNGKVPFDTIVPTMLSNLSPVVIATVIVLVLSASMSTLSSLVLSSSSTLTLDMIIPALKKEISQKKQVFIMRLFIVFFILVSGAIAIIKDKYGFTFIAQMMGVSWGALAGSFLAPFLYGLYWKRATKAGVWASFITGCGIELLQLYISLSGNNFSGPVLKYLFTSSIRSGAVAMLLGLLIVPVVSLIFKAPDANRVNGIFACYDKKTTADIRQSLGK